MVKTAGRFVTEEELRTYTKCSQLHFYQGVVDEEYLLQVVRYVFQALTSHSVRKDILDPLFLIQKYTVRATKELELEDKLELGQIIELKASVNRLLNEVFNIFQFSQYIPIYGPIEYHVKVSKTPVTLQVSGLYRSNKNQTLHIVCFTPYGNEHAAINDPVMQLKLQTLKRVVKPHYSGRARAKLHIFGVSPSGQLLYTSQESGVISKQLLKQLTHLVKNLEEGYHYPLVPCMYQCKFKKQCYPEKQ